MIILRQVFYQAWEDIEKIKFVCGFKEFLKNVLEVFVF